MGLLDSTIRSRSLLTMGNVNKMSYIEFIETFGNVIEGCTLFASAVYRERPFASFDELNNAFSKFMDDLPPAGKEGVLRLYPDLAGRLATARLLSNESTKEQAAAGLNKITDEQRQLVSKLNSQYKEKFGFPFVICARLNRIDTILRALELRMMNCVGKVEEAVTGTNEVKKIARLRLKDIVDETCQA